MAVNRNKGAINAPERFLGGSITNSKDLPKTSTGSLKLTPPRDPDIHDDTQGGAVKQFADGELPKVTVFTPESPDKPTPYKFR